MNRLTKKNNQGTGSWTQFGDEYIPAHNIKHKQCVNKLGKLEDIEDELGCPLEVVFKALKDKDIIIKHTYGLDEPIEKLKTHRITGLQFNKTDFVFWLYEDIVTDLEFDVNLKDYKKTWWLCSDLEDLSE